MDETKQEELEKAYKKEKDGRVRVRMLAVHMVHVRKMSISDTADILLQADRWVYRWMRRYEEGGLQGLRDLPGTRTP